MAKAQVKMATPHNHSKHSRSNSKSSPITPLVILAIIACCSIGSFASSDDIHKTPQHPQESGTPNFSSSTVQSGEPSLGPVKVSYSLGENKSALRVVGLFNNPTGQLLNATLISEVVYAGSRTITRGTSTLISPFSRVALMDYFVPEDDRGYTLISYVEFARSGDSAASRTGVQMVSGRVYAGLSYRSLSLFLLGVSVMSFALFWLQKSRMRKQLRVLAPGETTGNMAGQLSESFMRQ